MGKYIEVTDQSFATDVLNNDLPVLVDFWAPWCGPCRMLAPHLETIGAEFEGRAIVAKINVDEHNQIAMEYGVQGIPKLILFKNGAVVSECVGMPKNTVVYLREMISQAL